MELKIFSLIDEATGYLESIKSDLEIVSKDIEIYFEEIILPNSEGYLNINSRVKSGSSLKEKIIRNNYYKKYKTSEQLFSNLSDLIGIRIECRFVEDETKIYNVLKNHFNKVYSDGYNYNNSNENIRLDLSNKQPQEQKNGFEIFRIDGVYNQSNSVIKFELQIKSLVNIFWGEIEHKIIYKNNTYMVMHNFLSDIMGSIKKNLSMIDNQLLLIYNQFNEEDAINPEARKIQLEKLLSKIIYEIFSTRMKNSIGMIVDFSESCETIMKYIFRTNNAENLDDYTNTLTKTISRLNDLSINEMNFNSKIKFERDILLDDEFCNIIGSAILDSVNSDFQWNLFFRMLFEIEIGNNAENFETFIRFLRNRFYENEIFLNLYLCFEKEEVDKIVDSIMKEIAYSFKNIDSIKFIYDYNIDEINEVVNGIIKIICTNINSYEQWETIKDIYLELFNLKILEVFNCKVKTAKAKQFIEKINNYSGEIEISADVLNHLDKLETVSEIKVHDVLELIKV